jgi:hypothetical protein
MSRSNALIRRRRRFLVVAEPIARPIANATLGGVASGSGKKVHHSDDVRIRVPSRPSRTNASRSRIRQIKPTGGRGPWRDATSRWTGRHACSCVRESRACEHGDGCWVGTYASRRPPRGPSHDDLDCICDWTASRSNGSSPARDPTRQGYGAEPVAANHHIPMAHPSHLHWHLHWHLRCEPPSVEHRSAFRGALAPWYRLRLPCGRCPHCVDNRVDVGIAGKRRCR